MTDQKISIELENTVGVNTARIKQVRSKQGLSIAGLEELISQLHGEKLCQRKISKSVLQRIEASDDRPIPFWQIQTIAMALNVELDYLIGELQKVRILDLVKVKKGSTLREVAYSVDGFKLDIMVEPGAVEAQDAIIKLVELLYDRKSLLGLLEKPRLLEQTKRDFELRGIVETLKTFDLSIFIGKGKQAAPYRIKEDRFGRYELDFVVVHSPGFDEEEYYGEYEGAGICDVLIISINQSSEDIIQYQHDMDPAGFVNKHDAFLIENIQRLVDGQEDLSFSEFQELPDDQFVSDQARRIEQRERQEQQKKGEKPKKKKDDEI
jgi:transcriptional regulator with XRE-family HTH domain